MVRGGRKALVQQTNATGRRARMVVAHSVPAVVCYGGRSRWAASVARAKLRVEH